MIVRIDRLVVASHNPNKIAEIAALLADLPVGIEVERGHRWPEVEETESTLEGNALLKAHAVYAYTGVAALADDTGLEVDALDGAPGVMTARYAGPAASYADNVAKLISSMDGIDQRTARFRTAIALVDTEGVEWVVSGELAGTIATAPRGDGGFGYDPVFEVGGRTLAEMSPAEKNRISHRSRALRALLDLLS